MFEDAPDHIATGAESLAEFARNAGMDNPDQCWLLDSRDVWVRNPFYNGPPVPHPEDDRQEETVTHYQPPAPCFISDHFGAFDDVPF